MKRVDVAVMIGFNPSSAAGPLLDRGRFAHPHDPAIGATRVGRRLASITIGSASGEGQEVLA
jgi:hypothetical protein